MTIDKPGIYDDIPEEEYHADPCPEPSLSASIAKLIWGKSPTHAWYAHPRLNPEYEYKSAAHFDLGGACHAALLEGDNSKIVEVDAADWRSKAAKELRDSAREAGLLPLLAAQVQQVTAMKAAALRYIDQTEIAGIFQDGKPEQTMIAQYQGAWMRSRTDWMTTDRKIILDYKTAGQSADAENFSRTALFKMGYDIQAAAYGMMNGLTGGPAESAFVWLVQESSPPYACSLIGASPAIMDLGEAKLMVAIEAWLKGINTGNWPGYTTRIAYPDVPPWELASVEQAMTGARA